MRQLSASLRIWSFRASRCTPEFGRAVADLNFLRTVSFADDYSCEMDEQKPDNQLIFGFPEEWADFRKRHSLLLDRFSHIAEATRIAFERVMPESEPIERFVMLYGRVCVEDFHEILLCCGNGYGFAALKLLRALYEKAVTLEYINNNPDELDAFLNHRYISEYKLFQAMPTSLEHMRCRGVCARNRLKSTNNSRRTIL
jgi:hypothetical protein